MISYIWAMDDQKVIGYQNAMPWHLPNDLVNFKKITLDHPIVMGRKTFDSIGRPLPGRENIVLTRNEAFQHEDVTVFHSVEAILDYIRSIDKEVFIMGGAELYTLFRDHVEKLYVTHIHESFIGDTYFPEWNWSDWRLCSSTDGLVNEKNKHPHTFSIYDKKQAK
ncbi:dihydrofolate reductase [Bacillus sp. 2205SS5-2]|uniref:dihydrofolate reductase n=1 Tax=Bacillus sp. 2205SS5-2 TaxID=3109031 RepID=UPI003004DB2E